MSTIVIEHHIIITCHHHLLKQLLHSLLILISPLPPPLLAHSSPPSPLHSMLAHLLPLSLTPYLLSSPPSLTHPLCCHYHLPPAPSLTPSSYHQLPPSPAHLAVVCLEDGFSWQNTSSVGDKVLVKLQVPTIQFSSTLVIAEKKYLESTSAPSYRKRSLHHSASNSILGVIHNMLNHPMLIAIKNKNGVDLYRNFNRQNVLIIFQVIKLMTMSVWLAINMSIRRKLYTI